MAGAPVTGLGWVIGFLVGSLAMAGDLASSFLKHRMALPPSSRASGLDQSDLVKNISVIGVVWGAEAERDPALISRNLAELPRWWEAGRLKPLVAWVFFPCPRPARR